MLERYFAEIKLLCVADPKIASRPFAEVVLYRDHEATIADLQGQLKAQAEEYEQVEQCLDEQISGLNQGNLDDEKKIAALQQRVAQLEGELKRYAGCGHDHSTAWWQLRCEDMENDKVILQRHLQESAEQLGKLQADHARVLGLVQALGVVGLPAEHARPDDFILLKTGEGWMAHTYNYWAKFATEEEARAYIALLEYRASLPAQRAKLAQGGA